jgi:LAS superfamily LD-carboxypeptidase LdcB
MKILITESQLQKILLEVEEGDPVKSGEKKNPTPKTKEYWDPDNPNCVGCRTDNGRLSNIVTVKSGKKNGSKIPLTSDSAPYYEKMVERMNADGLYFKSASGYRAYETQFEIVDWNKYEDSVKNVNLTTDREVKELGTWKTKNNDAVAVPGSSNHGLGYAVDVDYKGPTDAQNWVRKNGKVYGWYWGEVKTELWHFTFHKAPIFSKMPGPDDELINLMEELQKEIETANFAIEEGGDPMFEYENYCSKIGRLDDKGFSLLGKSTLPPNVNSDNVKEYCYKVLAPTPLPIKTADRISSEPMGELVYDKYLRQLNKDYDLENMTKRELKKLVRKVKKDGREDLSSTIKRYIPTPLKDLYDIYIRQ